MRRDFATRPRAKLWMRLALTALFVVAASRAASAKPTRFWNLTANTITKFELAPAGTGQFGADLTKMDKDGSVDADERLKIGEVKSGSYDARFTDSKGRVCTVKNVAIKDGDIFSIDEKQLDGCSK